jgi:uncharacterized protein (TIGR02145 family)
MANLINSFTLILHKAYMGYYSFINKSSLISLSCLIYLSASFFSCNEEAQVVLPTVIIGQVSDITSTTANVGAQITSDGNAEIIERGFVYDIEPQVTFNNTKILSGAGLGPFQASLDNLVAGKKIYIRAFATNSAGTAFSEEISFTTSVTTAKISTSEITDITLLTAKGGGNVTNDGGLSITSRGICWSTTNNPTINNNKAVSGEGLGAYTSNMSGLTPSTKYYVRAFAINDAGIAYGEEKSFSTLSPSLPTVATSLPSEISFTSAKCVGNVSNNGGADVIDRGFVYGLSSNPTINDNKKSVGSGLGEFAGSLIDLKPGTKYYIRAFATNSAGTAYGLEQTFTTLAVTTPTILSTQVFKTYARGIAIRFTIGSDGGAPITTFGSVWSTSPNPTMNDSKISYNSTPSEIVTMLIEGLLVGTKYYIKPFVTNLAGTVYGTELVVETNKYSTVSDIDGNSYQTIAIGNQIWMAENLKVSRYSNGDQIPYVTNNQQWANLENLKTGAWVNYDENPQNEISCGKLYNWFAVADSRGLCPSGWHIPSETEWLALEAYLDGNSFAGGSLKSLTGWTPSSFGKATNLTGFSAIGCGWCFGTGEFDYWGTDAVFWSSTNSESNRAMSRRLVYNSPRSEDLLFIKWQGTSVRCIKNQ